MGFKIVLGDGTEYQNGQWIWTTDLKWIRFGVIKYIPVKALTHKSNDENEILLKKYHARRKPSECFSLEGKKKCQELCRKLNLEFRK